MFSVLTNTRRSNKTNVTMWQKQEIMVMIYTRSDQKYQQRGMVLGTRLVTLVHFDFGLKLPWSKL